MPQENEDALDAIGEELYQREEGAVLGESMAEIAERMGGSSFSKGSRARETVQQFHRGVAALLSLLLPGLGQLYRSQFGAALAWFVFVVLGYFFLLVPGIILHIGCVVFAALPENK